MMPGRSTCFVMTIALVLPALLLASRPAASGSIEAINQGGTPLGPVLIPAYVEQIQALADSQGGSTVRFYDPDVVELRLKSSTPSIPGLVAQNAVIPEGKRKTRTQHSASIAEVANGKFVAAWYGGTWERMGDVAIWCARYTNGKWGKAKKIAKPRLDENIDEGQWFAPCWNPALLYNDQTDTLLLFYRVGNQL